MIPLEKILGLKNIEGLLYTKFTVTEDLVLNFAGKLQTVKEKPSLNKLIWEAAFYKHEVLYML